MRNRLLAALAAAVLVALPARAQETDDRPVLRLFCWSNYFAKDTLAGFERDAGCRVELSTYGSNEEMEDRMLQGLIGIDVIFPSDHVIRKLLRHGQLERLEPNRLPNLKNLAARFRNLSYDPKNSCSVPYMWGTTGLGVNRLKVSGKVDTWSLLFDAKYSGKIMMLDDARVCIGLALKFLGKSINTRNQADLEAAKDLLVRQRPLVAQYHNEAYRERLADGSVWIAVGYSGDIAGLRSGNAAIFYAVPEEGTILWTDNLCIVGGSMQKDLAHKFIDYLLRPEVSAAITNETFFASPLEPAQKLIKPEILVDRSIFPTQKVLDKSEFLEDLGPGMEAEYKRIWKEVKGEG